MARIAKHDPSSILEAALSLFYEDGVKVPTSRIATAAGVPNGTLFHQFASKQALIDALYVSIKSDLARSVGELDPSLPLRQRMKKAWDGWLKWARENPKAHVVGNLLHNSNLVSEEAVSAGYEIAGAPLDLMLEAQKAGLLVPMPIAYLASLIPHHIDEAVKWGLSDEQGSAAFDVLWRGMTVNQDSKKAKEVHR
jgi:AcrR family transcriptional regulator